jgi:hypothetical protein
MAKSKRLETWVIDQVEDENMWEFLDALRELKKKFPELRVRFKPDNRVSSPLIDCFIDEKEAA